MIKNGKNKIVSSTLLFNWQNLVSVDIFYYF